MSFWEIKVPDNERKKEPSVSIVNLNSSIHVEILQTCLVAAVQSVLPQLQLQVTCRCVEVAAEGCGFQLLLQLLHLLFLQLISTGLQVPVGVKGLFYCLDWTQHHG